MFVLAIDTATPAVTAGVVDLDNDTGKLTELASRVTVDARAHGELVTPHVLDAVRDAGTTLAGLDAITCGAGPGPYTGLRAGLVTAAALAESLGVPAYPVCSLDAIAVVETGHGEPFLVLTDARRREVYWAGYDAGGARTTGPAVDTPDTVPAEFARRVEYAHPTPLGLVAACAEQLRARTEPGPLTPLYLRKPHAVEPSSRKRVTT